jgi:imidazolonepropionase-like amidohydrolase
MKRTPFVALCLLAGLWASDQIPAPPQDHPILLQGGTLHTVSGDVLPETDLLFDGGKIVRIEKGIVPEPGMEVIPIHGRHVYPGFIAATTSLGLVEINAVRATRDFAEVGDLNPNVRANVSYNPDSELIPVSRSNGVLLANVTPVSGLISGQSSLMMLDGWTWEEATLQHPTGLHLNWPDMRIRTGPKVKKSKSEQEKERREKLQKIDDLFDQVRAYARMQQAIPRQARLEQGHDLRLESMIPYVMGEATIFVHANEVQQIAAAVHWAERQGVKIVIVGGRDAWRLVDLLKDHQVPVVYQSVLALPYRRYEDYDQAYKTPAQLYAAGVPFCISSSSSSFAAANLRNLPYHAAMAAAFGLPAEEALRSITLSAAEILGVADRVGSLEAGKDATLFIADGDPLDIRTQVELVFIQGKKIDLSDRHKQLYHKYQEKYRQLGILD